EVDGAFPVSAVTAFAGGAAAAALTPVGRRVLAEARATAPVNPDHALTLAPCAAFPAGILGQPLGDHGTAVERRRTLAVAVLVAGAHHFPGLPVLVGPPAAIVGSPRQGHVLPHLRPGPAIVVDAVQV